MFKIRRNDIVYVISGKDKGKKGKVLAILTEKKRALVEGINLLSTFKRRSREDQKGGIIKVESPLSISNLMLFCKHCDRPVRTRINLLKDGTKTRVCKKCKEVF